MESNVRNEQLQAPGQSLKLVQEVYTEHGTGALLLLLLLLVLH